MIGIYLHLLSTKIALVFKMGGRAKKVDAWYFLNIIHFEFISRTCNGYINSRECNAYDRGVQ